MADELKIGGSVDPKLLTGLKEYQAAIRSIDLLYKQNKLSADEVKVAVKQLQDRVKESNIDWTKQVSLMTSLHHVNERAAVGFKSMSRTMKEMFAEQRVGNRILSEMQQSVSSLSGVIGGDAGKLSGGLIGTFQGLEFAMQGAGRALSTMSGSLVGLGATLGTVATPIAVAGAGFLTWLNYMKDLNAEIQKTRAEIAGMQGRTAEAAAIEMAAAEKDRGGIVGWGAGIISRFATGPVKGIAAATAGGAREAARQREFRAYEKWAQASFQDQKKADEEAARAAGPAWGRRITPSEGSDPYGAMRSAFGVRGTSEIAPGAAFAGRVRAPNAPDTAGGIKIAQDEFSSFQQSFMAGTAAMGNTLSMQVGGAFASVFGGAHTLLGSFASAFASTMADLASRWVFGKVFGGLLSLIPGVGPALAAGTTLADTRGIGPSSAGGGGEVLVEIRNAIQNMELRVDNVGLYMGSERGRVQYATR